MLNSSSFRLSNSVRGRGSKERDEAAMAAPPPPFALQGLHQWSQPPPPEAPPPPPHLQERFHGFPSSQAGAPESQVAGAPPPSAPGLVTLLVRHLPEAMPQEMLSRLFSYYGAASVRPCVGGRLIPPFSRFISIVFLEFPAHRIRQLL